MSQNPMPQASASARVYQQQPVASGGMVIAPGGGGDRNAKNLPADDNGRAWSHGLCGCFESCETCVISLFFPCVTYGKNRQRLEHLTSQGIPDPERGGSGCSGACVQHGLLTLIGLGCLLQTGNRGSLRKRYNIKGGLSSARISFTTLPSKPSYQPNIISDWLAVIRQRHCSKRPDCILNNHLITSINPIYTMISATNPTNLTSSKPGEFTRSHSSLGDSRATETRSTLPEILPPTTPLPVYQSQGRLSTVADCSEHSSSPTLSLSPSTLSITSSPSTAASTAASLKESERANSPASDLTTSDEEESHVTLNPISKRTVELSESHKARQRRMSHPPISPSTLAISPSRRGSIPMERLQNIDEDQPAKFQPKSDLALSRGRSHPGKRRGTSPLKPKMTQCQSTSSILRVNLHPTTKPGLIKDDLLEEEVEKKAAIVAATAAAWAVKQNRAQANAGSDKRFNLQARTGTVPSFTIIQSSTMPTTSSPSRNQKSFVNEQPGCHPGMSVSSGRDWNSSRYSVDENFCLAACCPGVVYARNQSRLAHLDETDAPHPGVIAAGNDITTVKPETKSFFNPLSWTSCLGYTLLSPLCLSSYLQSKQRAKTRKRYGIGGDAQGDCAASLFCGPCELARESREIAAEEDSLADAMDHMGAIHSLALAGAHEKQHI
ncbi:hypothetical protein CVT24_007565 [Panaeolus cyanescens]|uniref:PLAC8-domain-containing protein n=1 Tax=Panaeolus cyanescens TaxID=181874 RepID=A0A409VR65_9AGAR|nr:hypothetical protein CVT24_007565 [Panaeolus cyanescens]